jgi:UPF0716 family protein affecting phage T7 exclusion
MRWLLILLLVSLAGLLIAAAGLARHIWLHHKRQQTGGEASPGAELVTGNPNAGKNTTKSGL